MSLTILIPGDKLISKYLEKDIKNRNSNQEINGEINKKIKTELYEKLSRQKFKSIKYLNNNCSPLQQIKLAHSIWQYKFSSESHLVITNSDYLIREINSLIMLNYLGPIERDSLLQRLKLSTQNTFSNSNLTSTTNSTNKAIPNSTNDSSNDSIYVDYSQLSFDSSSGNTNININCLEFIEDKSITDSIFKYEKLEDGIEDCFNFGKKIKKYEKSLYERSIYEDSFYEQSKLKSKLKSSTKEENLKTDLKMTENKNSETNSETNFEESFKKSLFENLLEPEHPFYLSECDFSPNLGFECKSFDNIINFQNYVQDALIWGD